MKFLGEEEQYLAVATSVENVSCSSVNLTFRKISLYWCGVGAF